MSISDNYVPVKQIGDGSTTVFTDSWAVFNATYLDVYLENISTGVQTLQAEGTDYTLTFDASGFSVTFLTAPTSSYYVVIGRSIDRDQPTIYKTSKGYQGKTHENSYDRIVGMIQDIQDNVDRSVKYKLGAGVTSADTAVLDTETYKGKALGFNSSTGKPEPVTPSDGSSTSVTATGSTTSRTLANRFADTLHLQDFSGITGDGVADDAAGLEVAFNAADGKVLDGAGKTYRMDSKFTTTSENIVLRNMVLDMSNLANVSSPDFGVTFAGAQGTATNLSSDASKGDSVLTVADTSNFVVDGYAYLESTAVFESVGSVVLGQIVKVKSVDSGTQLTLYNDILYDFTTALTGKISPLTTKKNITLENVIVIGSNANNQSGFYFDKCENVTLRNCHFTYCHYSAATFSRSINVLVDGCSARYARSTGLSYGFTIRNGCYSVRVVNSYGEDTRHFVTVGDNEGVNLFVVVKGNHVTASKDAGIDSHGACDYMLIDGNTVEGASTDSGNHDGIIFQGLNCVISNNIVVGFRRHSIWHQLLPDIGEGSTVITGNLVSNAGTSTSTDVGIRVSNECGSGNTLRGVTIAGNSVVGANESGSQVYAVSGDIENISISGNAFRDTTSRGVMCRAAASQALRRISVANNIFEGNSASEGVYFLGTTAKNVFYANASGNIIDGFSFGIRAVLVEGLIERGNTILNFYDPYEVTTTSSGIELDPTSHGNPLTVTNSTFTMEEDDTHFICNRAATITLTLLDPTVFVGRELYIKTIQAQQVDSASSNVVPIDGTAAGTSILPATDGAWCSLKSDGSNWIIMSQG